MTANTAQKKKKSIAPTSTFKAIDILATSEKYTEVSPDTRVRIESANKYATLILVQTGPGNTSAVMVINRVEWNRLKRLVLKADMKLEAAKRRAYLKKLKKMTQRMTKRKLKDYETQMHSSSV